MNLVPRFLHRSFTHILVASGIAAASFVPAYAANVCAGPVCVESPWTRATPGGAQNAAVYLTISNSGDADTLTAVSSTAASSTTLHQTMMSGGMAKMDMSPSLAIPAHGKASLAPNSYHVMLVGLKAPLKMGDSLALTLTFAKAGKLAVTVPVLAVGAMGPNGNAPQSAPDMNMSMGEMHH